MLSLRCRRDEPVCASCLTKAAQTVGALLVVCSLADSTYALWTDDFNNGDPLTNSTAVGWTASFIRPALGSMPNLPSDDVDPSDDFSYLAEPGRLDSSVTLRASHDGTNPGTLTLTTSSPLPELNFFAAPTQLRIQQWNAGPYNNGNIGGGGSFTNAFGTIVSSTGGGRVGEGNDEIWFRQDSGIAFFNKVNGVNANAPGTRTDFYGAVAASSIPYLTDDTGDFVTPGMFWPGTADLVMLDFDVELDATNAKVTVSTTNPTSLQVYSSTLEWAHGMTLADWNAGEAGGYVRIQSYAALAPTPTTVRGTDVTVGRIIAGIGDVGTFLEGDFDENGTVDENDLLLWQGGFGATGPDATHMTGDANADGQVDGADFLIWQQQFGTTPSAIAATTVPEPAAAALFIAASAAVATIRRVGIAAGSRRSSP